jgi:hypothetical protein
VEHRPLCTIDLIARGHAERCPGETCAFWDKGCALTRVEHQLDGRPDVAQLLLDLRRELDARSRAELAIAGGLLDASGGERPVYKRFAAEVHAIDG